MMDRNAILLFIMTLSIMTGIAFPGLSSAHTFGQVNQETYIYHTDRKLVIKLTVRMDAGILVYRPDRDNDGTFSLEEWEVLLRQLERAVTPNLVAALDGRPAPLQFVPPGDLVVDPKGFAFGATATFFYHVDLPSLHPGPHHFRLTDNNFKISGPRDTLVYFVHGALPIQDMREVPETWSLEFTFTHGRDASLDSSAIQGAPLRSAVDGESGKEVTRLIHYLKVPEPGTAFILIALTVSLFLGAAHALSPGHGKAMVAAFLVGERGRIRDAVILGMVVTVTHVVSVYVFGFLALLLSRYAAPERFFPWIGVVSGLLIFLIGYWMLARRALHAADHHHDHDSGNRGGEPKITLRGLFSLGIAGGMVPCPTALVVMLSAIAFQKILFGFLLLFAFSLGLALVLIGVGILTVAASQVSSRFIQEGPWIRRLPVFSALVVMVAGISISLNALISSGIIRINV